MYKYKYKCVAAVNADKEDFYGVIGELKVLYPEMCENNNDSSDSDFLRSKFWQGEKRIMIQYSFSERSVTVFSEDWLGKFYEDREVTEGRFKPIASTSSNTKFTIKLSVIFTVVNTAVFALSFSFFYFDLDLHYLFSSAILFCIYFVSDIIFKNKTTLKYDEILFIQLGIPAVFIAILLMFIIFIIFFPGWGFALACWITLEYAKTEIISIALNMMFLALLRLITNTVKNKK